jgi:hypothetical protein
LGKVSNFFYETLIFGDLFKKKSRLFFMVQVRNPFPGEEWGKEIMEEQRGPAVLPLLFFPQGRIALPNLIEKLPNITLAINDP